MGDRIFCITSCGYPCGHPFLCPKCQVHTVKANGLPEAWAKELDGLKAYASGYIDPIEFCEVMVKLREMVKRKQPKPKDDVFINRGGEVHRPPTKWRKK